MLDTEDSFYQECSRMICGTTDVEMFESGEVTEARS